jgi:HEAT repeat protein
MKTVTILALALLLLGCGPQAGRQAKRPGTKRPTTSTPSKSKREAKPKSTLAVHAESFAGIPEAIRALTEAAKSSNEDEVIRADKWLVMQGGAAVEPLANVLNDEQAHLAARFAACRILRRLGNEAKPALKQALGSESKQMRLKAIETLGRVRPTDPDIIQTLVDLIGAEDERVRSVAILSLGDIGPPAKDMCADKLVAILNDAEENETLRDAAKRALKKVNPRRNFTD